MRKCLTELKDKEKGKIVSLEGGGEFQRKVGALNIRIGKEIEKVASHPFSGPVVIRVDGRRITLGKGMAAKIFVE